MQRYSTRQRHRHTTETRGLRSAAGRALTLPTSPRPPTHRRSRAAPANADSCLQRWRALHVSAGMRQGACGGATSARQSRECVRRGLCGGAARAGARAGAPCSSGPRRAHKAILRAALAFLLDAGEALRNLRSRGAGGTRQAVGGAVVAWPTGMTGMLGGSGVRVAQKQDRSIVSPREK